MPTPARKPRGGSRPSELIALVLAGGGARGAYEAGALSALAPALAAEGRKPNIFIGTSVGALNTAFLAARAHEPIVDAAEAAEQMWRRMRWGDAIRPLVSPFELGRVLSLGAILANLPCASLPGLLDPTPLRKTLERIASFDQIASNVKSGDVASAAVVATAYSTTNSIVFHHGRPDPRHGPLEPDRGQGIEYAATTLAADHVLASAAIPAVFPPVQVRRPRAAAGWYSDGGVRLNAPLKPALELGAERAIVIGLNSSVTPDEVPDGPAEPEWVDGAAQILQVVLADQLAEDVATLATVNESLGPGEAGGTPAPPKDPKEHRHVEYIFIAPPDRLKVGKLARDIYKKRYGCLGGLHRDASVALLGRFLKADRSDVHGELLSYLFIATEFLTELMALGREDANRWVGETHDGATPLWQFSKL